MIDSLKHPLVAMAKELDTCKGRTSRCRALAEGSLLVEQMLTAGDPLTDILVSSACPPEEADRLGRAARGAGVPLSEVRAGVLRHVTSGAKAPDVLAIVELPAPRSKPSTAGQVWLVTDGVADPGNLGSIIRTAVGLGVTTVVTTTGSDLYARKVVEASRGAVFRIDLHPCDRPAEALKWLRSQGVELLVSAGNAEETLDQWLSIPRSPQAGGGKGRPPLAVAVGNETTGVSRELLEAADHRVAIPMNGRVESLNVGAAAAILLWALTDPGGDGA